MKDESSLSGLCVNEEMNTWLAVSHCPGPFLAILPALAYQHPPPPQPPPQWCRETFQVSWACLVALLCYLLNHLNGRGEIISVYLTTHLQDRSLWRLDWATCNSESISREGWAGFINAKWNPVFLPDALIYGAMLVRACVGDFFLTHLHGIPWMAVDN